MMIFGNFSQFHFSYKANIAWDIFTNEMDRYQVKEKQNISRPIFSINVNARNSF